MTTLTGATIRATVAVKDRERAKQFYRDALGLAVDSEGDEVLTFRGEGGTLLDVYQSDFAGTAKNTVASFQVGDLDAAVAGLQAHDVAFEDYSGAGAASPIMERGAVRGAWFRDPEGNILGLIELVPAAT